MRILRILLAVTAVALLSGAYMAYPLYPSPMSVCGLVESRAKNIDRWASPHRGAVVILKGELYGLPMAGGHEYAFQAHCKGYDLLLAIEESPLTVQSLETRSVLRQLPNQNWRVEERHAPFTIAARVASEVEGCFTPAMVLTALGMQARGGVVVEKRAKPIGP